MLNEKETILIVDTNIFLRGFNFLVLNFKKIFTAPKIFEEIRGYGKNLDVLNRLEAAISSGRIMIRKPSQRFILRVVKRSKNTGDYKYLSEADIELIALSLEIKERYNENILLLTDDYSMQNVCKDLNLSCKSYLKKGIKKKITWELYCPACKKIFNTRYQGKKCENCGVDLKRRPKIKK